MKDPQNTFRWIVSILKKHDIPFVVTGGLAAKSYGSPRPLNDIDIDISAKGFDKILQDIKPYITFGPDHLKDERWDLSLIVLNHYGQDIDLSAGETIKICDARNGVWHDNPTDFNDVEQREIFGITVPVISRKSLVDYKSMLAGEHQQVDIKAVLKGSRLD